MVTKYKAPWLLSPDVEDPWVCALAPSQTVLNASSDGVPKNSAVKSNYEQTGNTDG